MCVCARARARKKRDTAGKKSGDLHGVGREKVVKASGIVLHIVGKGAAYLKRVTRVLSCVYGMYTGVSTI